MPSIRTSKAQALPSAGFFRTLGDPFTVIYQFNSNNINKDGDNIQDIITTGGSEGLYPGTILRDMGHRITFVDDAGLVSVVLNEVSRVNGSASEGVSEAIANRTSKEFVVVFSSNPNSEYMVNVARLG
jgi:hypothetical protein